jgi:aspartate 1-decarboxylase
VISYAAYDQEEIPHHRPRVVHVDTHNQILATDNDVASLLTPGSDPLVAAPVA